MRKYDFNVECVSDGLLNKVLVLGKNGCGKSNLGLALFDISYTLTYNLPHRKQLDTVSFLNGNSSKKYATFTYEFQNGKDIIVFKYSKLNPNSIVYESLHLNGKQIFLRDGINNVTDYSNLTLINANTLRIANVNESLSVLRFIYNNSIQTKKSPVQFIMDFVSHMLYYRADQVGNQLIGYTQIMENIEPYIMSKGLVNDFQNFLKKYAGLNVELQRIHNDGMEDILVQKLKNKYIPFSMISSSGTNALMLFYYWSKHFENVSFLYMDDFGALYHYGVSETILKEVISNRHFQTVFTSHNIELADNNLMRPDCYLILSNHGLESMPNITDRELREGHNLKKLLRGGEFDK